MVCWRPELHVSLLLGPVVLGCSVGQGQGDITASVQVPSCDLDESAYALEPSFFAAEVTGRQLDIRIQRGSDIEGSSDGILIHVRDASEVFLRRLGIPIPIDPEDGGFVQSVLYLNETCPSGFPDYFTSQPVILEAQSGQVVFSAIYAPDIEPGATLIEGALAGVVYADPNRDDTRAVVQGTFSFFYQRGAPAQRFP